MTTDTDDLLALADWLAAEATKHNASIARNDPAVVAHIQFLTRCVSRLRAAPGGQGEAAGRVVKESLTVAEPTDGEQWVESRAKRYWQKYDGPAEQAQGVSGTAPPDDPALDAVILSHRWRELSGAREMVRCALTKFAHSPAPASPLVPQVPAPMTGVELNRIWDRDPNESHDEGLLAVQSARDAQWLAALGGNKA